MAVEKKPHVVCIPYPSQPHINPMIKLAKLLHQKGGFHVSFVNTEFTHSRLLHSGGPDFLFGLPDFRFLTIPDGLPPTDPDDVQDYPLLSEATAKHCLEPFCGLISKLNQTPDVPPVTCIVSDGIMSFTLKAAEMFGLPDVLFWTTSACGFMGFAQFPHLIERGLIPLKDMSDMFNGYLDTALDWVPGMKDIRLKDIPSFIRTTDSSDILLNFATKEAERAPKATAIILNTFDALEHDVLKAVDSAIHPCTYTIGPIDLMVNRIKDNALASIGSNLGKEENECINWLDTKEPNSVVYVNFGRFLVMPKELLVEFAWGLANSGKDFLWIVSQDLVATMFPDEFLSKTEGRGMLAGWCDQEQVLNHPAVGGFVMYGEWNWVIESICGGVPVVYWPFYGEQMTNCRYSCVEWGIGMEIDMIAKRNNVEGIIRELIDGEEGKAMREKALEWKDKAHQAATASNGSSYLNFDKLLELLLQ